ncbi:hypothetical protein [Tetragenococcus halophilus]|uniref:hypothetical protein n=1 Tax=Tetragenococcus halophilus TaxID=51669 RepID=UPI0030100B05
MKLKITNPEFTLPKDAEITIGFSEDTKPIEFEKIIQEQLLSWLEFDVEEVSE